MVSTMFKTTIENSSLNFRKHETRPHYGAEMSGFTARLSFLLNAHITCEYLVQDHGNAPLSAGSAFTRSHTAYNSQITNGISCPISNEHHAQILMWSVLFINNLTLRSLFISCHDIAAWINFWLAQLSVCFNVQDERVAFSSIPLQNTPTLEAIHTPIIKSKYCSFPSSQFKFVKSQTSLLKSFRGTRFNGTS